DRGLPGVQQHGPRQPVREPALRRRARPRRPDREHLRLPPGRVRRDGRERLLQQDPPGPPGRAGDASSYLTTYTFNAPMTVLFVIPDNVLFDNSGGVSIVVSPVPEPSALFLAT